VLFADSFAIPAASVLAYGRTLRALAAGLARSRRKSPGFYAAGFHRIRVGGVGDKTPSCAYKALLIANWLKRHPRFVNPSSERGH